MESSIVYGGYHYKLNIEGIDPDLMFSIFEPPELRVDGIHFYTWDANGNPMPSTGGGRQPMTGEWSIGRARDEKHALYDWFQKVHEEGAATNKKDCTVSALSPDGQTTLHTWKLNGTVPISYRHSGANAQSQEILVETATLLSEDCSLDFG